ncbi:MAG: outer membrane lipoprotein-sorting protein [candidate division WOR-3 bacterium]|nr:MAG: outer membrane lipoprotein-sorting protein [candidate division WOR-3 bacterium]
MITTKKRLLLILLGAICASAQTGSEILERVDINTVVTSSHYDATMKISLGGTIREKRFTGYAVGKSHAYMEFTYPARDKGTRFLKIEDEMWIYMPSIEKATKIAGHMLRQSMMGSDFSYDDILENEKLTSLYDIELIGTDTLDGRPCFVLQLQAKVPEVNYYSRKLWVDKEMCVSVKVELFAKSGKLLKEVSISEFKRIDGYTFPTLIRMVNKLRKDTYTELSLEEVELDIETPHRIFTRAYLERK